MSEPWYNAVPPAEEDSELGGGASMFEGANIGSIQGGVFYNVHGNVSIQQAYQVPSFNLEGEYLGDSFDCLKRNGN